jgi:hypothetical protein
MPGVMKRLLAALPASIVFLLLAAPAALADAQEQVSGEGTYGVADDKVVTNAGFIVILAFPLLILCLSLLQWRLDKRKERRKAISKSLTAGRRWQSGW